MPRVYVNGVNLHYEVSGLGFSVVLCHGTARSHQDWMYQVPVLAEKYQVITFDFRGHGSSDEPSSPDDYSISIFVQDAYALLNYLGVTECCLVGHSMGGMVAQLFTLDYPDLVRALVLVDTTVGATSAAPVVDLEQFLDKIQGIAFTEGLEAEFEYSVQLNPKMQKRFEKYPRQREISKRMHCETSLHGYIYMMRAFSKWSGVQDRLSEIPVPTLVIVGNEDTNFRPSADILANSIPHARLHVIPGVGHYPFQDSYEVFNNLLLGFLSEALSS